MMRAGQDAMAKLAVWGAGLLLGLNAGRTLGAGAAPGDGTVQFNRDIRPILAENCFACHGPDSAARKAGLRLDHRATALEGGKSGRPAVVPGHAVKSELWKRLTSRDPEEVMPPPKTGKALSARQLELMKSWLEDGAAYQGHWAFVPPARTAPPELKGSSRVGGRPPHPVDAFIRATLEREGLPGSPPAAPATLLRRACLDLTGLPPTPAEATAFELAAENNLDAAYEDAVDRLLNSPHYGENMAVRWLDLARYADTSGFQGDPVRTMWRWRDYVIESFNHNKRFDRFTLEQIAGDLLPDASLESKLATAFHRNHRFNTEFGAIDEEWRVENVIDRVETVGATWLALTVGCARCHDHKYDPISQREFYQLFAFFNNVPERGVFWDIFGNDALAFDPAMRAPGPADLVRRQALDRKITAAAEGLRKFEEPLGRELSAWEGSGRRWTSTVPMPAGLVLHLAFDGSFAATYGTRSNVVTTSRVVTNRLADGSLARATNVLAQTNLLRFAEALKITAPSRAEFAVGPLGQAWKAQPGSRLLITSNILDQPKATIAFWVGPATSNGVLLTKMGRQKLHPLGLALSLTNGRVRLELAHEQFDFDGTMVPVILTSQEALPLNEWTHLAVVLDGSRRKRGPALLINGRVAPADLLYASARTLPPFSNQEPLQLGDGAPAGFSGWIDDVRIYDRALADREVLLLFRLRDTGAFAVPAARRSPTQQAAALGFYRDFISPSYAAARASLETLQAERTRLEETWPLVMVMEEKPGPASARVLFRGQYDSPREAVAAGIPSALGTLPANAPPSRLGLAQWLVSSENPLTARVYMNRLWEQMFGVGLVRTSENLGVQSDPPSHPELLDWLATEFIQRGWDIKAMVRLLVTSATYRQSSAMRFPGGSPHPGLARDPQNRWLWHGPRFRLSAEAIRDQALAVSGLLDRTVGGPSVTPYLPGEKRAFSPDLYRRTVYSFWQRTQFNPSLAAFDATAREACTVKRPRTNTPLQALALLNEVTYVEAARRLAEQMMKGASIPEARLRRGFELALGRPPDDRESGLLRRLLEQERKNFQADETLARKLIRQGATKPDPALPPAELAAHMMVAGALLNLDEFVTKE